MLFFVPFCRFSRFSVLVTRKFFPNTDNLSWRLDRVVWALVAIAMMLLSSQVPAGVIDEQGRARTKKALTEVVVVSVDEAKRLYDLGAVFIDVRGAEEWHLGHIKNARHVSFKGDFAKLNSLSGIDKSTPLVFYCASLECKAGPYASAVSIQWGYKNVFYFQKGYFSWMLEDYPINMDGDLSTFAGDTIQIRKAK